MLASNGVSTAARNFSKSASVCQGLGEDQVGAGVGVGLRSLDRRVDTVDAGGVGARADDEVRVTPGRDRRTKSLDHLFGRHDALPSRCPQRLGLTWSSRCRPAMPASSRTVTVRAALIGSPKPVSASISVGQVGDRARSACLCAATSVSVVSPMSGKRQVRRRTRHPRRRRLRSRSPGSAWRSAG